MRAAIWRHTLITAALYVVTIGAVDRVVHSQVNLDSRAIEIAIAFAIVQIVAVLLMVIGLFVRKEIGVMRTAQSERVQPQIREALALHAIGTDQRAALEELQRQSPNDVRETLLAMIVSTRGEPRERMAALAHDLGIAEDAKENKVERLRKTIRLRQAESFADVVAAVANENLIVRAIAAEELAPYAPQIPEDALQGALRSTDVAIVIATLDMLRAWRRAMRVGGFENLLHDHDARVRERALLALPYAGAHLLVEDIAAAVTASLADKSARVRAAAARAARHFRIAEAAERLGVRLGDPDREVAVAAAFALAALGERGSAILQRAVLSADRAAASVAFEAQEKEALGWVQST